MSISLLLGALLAVTPLISGSQTSLDKRDTAVFYPYTEFMFLYDLNFDDACYGEYGVGYEGGCALASNNDTWLAMTWDSLMNPAEYIWEADDATTANCLAHLHYVQDTECISVKGSECEAKKGTSKILNSRKQTVSYGIDTLSLEDYAAIEKASNAIIGTKVNSNADNEFHIASGVYLGRMNLDGFFDEVEGFISIVFGGAEQC